VRTEIQTGVREGEWIEVTNRYEDARSPSKENWVPVESSAQVLIGSKLSTLTDGAPVRLSDSPRSIEKQLANTTPGATGGD
jgi:hypothetical protein